MALDAEGQALLDQAVREWDAGRHYEAHEILEDVIERFEQNDPSFQIGLALIQIAAALHKLNAQVGPAAVPGKLDKAQAMLAGGPPVWLGMDLANFLAALAVFAARPDVRAGRAPPADVARPRLIRAR